MLILIFTTRVFLGIRRGGLQLKAVRDLRLAGVNLIAREAVQPMPAVVSLMIRMQTAKYLGNASIFGQ